MNRMSNTSLKQAIGFFAAAIDAVLIYNYSSDLTSADGNNVQLFILRLLLTIFISAGVWLIICYVIDKVDTGK